MARSPAKATTGPPLDWWTVLGIFAVAGLVGGSLATLQLVKIPDLFKPRDQDYWRKHFLRDCTLAVLCNAAGGFGGAYAALFVMILDNKIGDTLGEKEKLTYAVTGVVAGFLGLQLLNLAAGALIKAARSAAGEAAKEQVEGVKQKLVQQVADVQQRVDAQLRDQLEAAERDVDSAVRNTMVQVDQRLNKLADATARAATALGTPAGGHAAGVAGASPVRADDKALDRQARADLMSAIIRGRLIQSEWADGPEVDRLIAALERGLATFPDRREAFIVLGQLYKMRGDLDTGIAVLRRGLAAMEATGAADPIDVADTHYNLACYYALQQAAEDDPQRRAELRRTALDHLRPAVERRPDNVEEAAKDPDFRSLREDPEFRGLVPIDLAPLLPLDSSPGKPADPIPSADPEPAPQKRKRLSRSP